VIRLTVTACFQLAAGNYTLTCGRSQRYDGRILVPAAGFCRRDADRAGCFAGTQSLTPGKGSRVFSFAGTKDQIIYFDSVTRAGFINSAPTWRLIDPFGEPGVQRQYDTDQANVRLPSSGIYSLLIEGRRNESAATPTVTFNAHVVPQRPAVPLDQASTATDLQVSADHDDAGNRPARGADVYGQLDGPEQRHGGDDRRLGGPRGATERRERTGDLRSVARI